VPVARGVLVVLVAVAVLLRVVAVPLLRRRHPAAARFVARWWAAVPFLALAAVVTWALGWPGLALSALALVVVWARPDVFGLPRS
jgi:bacteriorhodopsin